MQIRDWVLVHEETNKQAVLGSSLTSFRGEPTTLMGGMPPHKPASTGRVWVKDADSFPNAREFFPSVFGLKWVKQESEV